ncbi:MAG: aminotransferase class I/II-fold pyridoxal phosphate-dependent enzyme [Xanthomonadales bacterium]|nr:aminotransferase class I/II-fold pyridoxal phosphate-dependent enzyme [Xanthomonadales bacterium]NIN60755.1 aminotransferase class I/II-fold pyridoxal phosphate-dependent enzyme [Xanthomonadales bacterium]NIN76117.1 aminotransferase class I/II-fold pyridoxal phosphate-dependent enzyme [Xanthomonadales bacterium]NIO15338.1 aminotransferase class I/II-fold pyridoxal phosphate-dependent enzyme [Xanthomonadales bacterium]NIP13148.1 aminotransferase class I/II-fold pyridoxal phosphate-dependent e
MPLKISNRVNQIKPAATIAVSMKAAELRAAGRDIISLGFGEPDFDTPDHIKQAAMQAIREGETKYPPVDGTAALKQAIIRKLRDDNRLAFEPGQIIVSNGAKQALFNLLTAVLNEDHEVIVPAPYWVSYPDMVKLAGGQPVMLATDAESGFKITPRQLEASLTDNTRLLIVNSPSNPTGQVYGMEEYRALGAVLAEHPKVLVVCDDIYEHIYWGDEPFATFLNACPDLIERTVVINGVSKAYAMTGWRIGYAAGPEPLIRAMRKVQSQVTSGACSISQAAAAAALDGPQECVREMRDEFKRRYEYLVPALNAIEGVECPGCDGAFYAFPSFEAVIERLPGVRDDVELAAWFLEHAGVAMVPGTAFGAPGRLRLSFATSMENLQDCVQRIESALRTALDGQAPIS